MEPVDIPELLRAVISLANNSRMQGPPVYLDIAGGNPGDEKTFTVAGQGSRLAQVIRNLIDNAISFSPENGKIDVLLRMVDNEVEIAVEDEGPGIDMENQRRIFERFYTDRPHESSFGQNSGLGLSISKQIVEVHGGRIFAENRKSGSDGKSVSGARLVVRLPAAAP